MGIGERFPDECGIWVKEVDGIRLASQKDLELEAQQKKAQDELSEARVQMESSIRFAVVNAVFSGYPLVAISCSGAPLTNKHIARSIVADASPVTQLSPLLKKRD